MSQHILLGFTLGLFVSAIGFYLVQQPLKKIGILPMEKIKKKVLNRYILRNIAILIFFYITFKTTNTTTLVSAAFGLTMTKFFLIVKQYIIGKG
ncbi:MAG: hypothetical protein GX923_07900 [Clostridia bacterium]|jgi:hypothetical protein|nr:hypothetical protein [Clostridia bacterium]